MGRLYRDGQRGAMRELCGDGSGVAGVQTRPMGVCACRCAVQTAMQHPARDKRVRLQIVPAPCPGPFISTALGPNNQADIRAALPNSGSAVRLRDMVQAGGRLRAGLGVSRVGGPGKDISNQRCDAWSCNRITRFGDHHGSTTTAL